MQNYNILASKPNVSLNPRPIDTNRPDRAWAGTLEPIQHTENNGHNLTIEWNVSDDITFKSITGYRNLKDDNSASGSGANAFLPLPFVTRNPAHFVNPLFTQIAYSDSTTYATTRQDQQSQEFQLIGDSDRLEWQVGALYFH
jgi:iron complex outermembrane receptor protein